MVGDESMADGLRALLRLDVGIHVGLGSGLLEIGQLEELTYYVILFGFRDGERSMEWQQDRLSMDEAIAHFLRLRHVHELGYDYERVDGGQDGESGEGSPSAR